MVVVVRRKPLSLAQRAVRFSPKELSSRMGREQGARHRESLGQVSQVAIAITFKKVSFRFPFIVAILSTLS